MKPFSNNLLEQEYAVTPSYLTAGSKRRSGVLIHPAVKFIVAHDTGNSGSTANGNVRYYQDSRNEISASAHIFVDDNQILECIPALTGPAEKAWHVRYKRQEDNILFGFHSNDAAIGVEYCFGGNINADEAYLKYVWVIAYLCWRFGLDPSKSIVGHHVLDPGRKIDPVNGLAKSRRSYTQLLLDVPAIYQQCGGLIPAEVNTNFPANIRANGLLNIRSGEPYRRAPILRKVQQGTMLTAVGSLPGERVNGIDKWYDLGGQSYCWSGATSEI